MGRIYFRSDSRSPEEIFKKGFTPRIDYGDLWWQEAIKARGYKNNRGIGNEAIDANAEACICLTTKLESAPIFPLNDKDTYIYAIVLPDATQIDYLGDKPVLVKDENSPFYCKDLVLDLHNFQAKQARNIYSFFAEAEIETDTLSAYAAWPLYAYEAIAYQVPSAAIVGGIKCIRSPLKNECVISCDYISEQGKKSYDRAFTFEGEFIANSNFSIARHIWLESKEFITTLNFNWAKKDVANLFNEVKDKKLETPNIYYGLGGKTL
ncbi:hypothetical protein [Legionella cardiaca]|uniref:Uncharacterized protein n=1 Tax=Legionella cardiaca TaxID=1071983 RepID=A0ABY8AP13_9GAMM|nr:hypothetical protein [Legionella cardiaca]WED42439.1 hypothetical protein PXX05_11000 [Legionella cardiaca]